MFIQSSLLHLELQHARLPSRCQGLSLVSCLNTVFTPTTKKYVPYFNLYFYLLHHILRYHDIVVVVLLHMLLITTPSPPFNVGRQTAPIRIRPAQKNSYLGRPSPALPTYQFFGLETVFVTTNWAFSRHPLGPSFRMGQGSGVIKSRAGLGPRSGLYRWHLLYPPVAILSAVGSKTYFRSQPRRTGAEHKEQPAFVRKNLIICSYNIS